MKKSELQKLIKETIETRMALKNAAKVAIQEYTERSVVDVKTHEDPNVPGTYALRAIMLDGPPVDFLVVGYNRSMTAGVLADELEECEWQSWPPTGAPKYFR